MRNNQNKEPSKADLLDAEWRLLMPCHDCAIADVCRYKNAIKRIDYPWDVFDINITCKIAHKYARAELNDQSDMQ